MIDYRKYSYITLLMVNRKVLAVKKIKDVFGCNLKKAKAIADFYQRKYKLVNYKNIKTL